MKIKPIHRTALALLALFALCRALPLGAVTKAPVHGFKVVNTYPHDATAFTQGLIFVDGALYEGTGRYDQSSIRRVTLETGRMEQMALQDGNYFGEGIVIIDSRLLQLTWRNRQGFVYDRDTFQRLDTFTYEGEGWGLTTDGERLIMSDGTATLRFLNAGSYGQIGSVLVRDGDDLVKGLNELEYIDGEVWANVLPTSRIARIDPETGRVNSWVDLTDLLTLEEIRAGAKVLNGIAHDADTGRIFVTGKLWSKLCEIEVVKRK